MLETLEEGRYYIIKGDDKEQQYAFTVRDTKDIQVFNVHTTYVMQWVLLGVGALVLVSGAIVLVLLIRRRKNGKST